MKKKLMVTVLMLVLVMGNFASTGCSMKKVKADEKKTVEDNDLKKIAVKNSIDYVETKESLQSEEISAKAAKESLKPIKKSKVKSSKKKRDSKKDSKKDTQEDSKKDIQEDSKKDIQEDSKKDLQEDSKKDTQEDSKKDSQEDSKKDTEQIKEEQEGNVTYQSDVTQEMVRASYWANLISDADKVLMDQEAIQKKNKIICADSKTHMYDLKNMEEDFNADDVKKDLAGKPLMVDVRKTRIGSHNTIYKNGKAMDTSAIDSWFAEMQKNILDADTSNFNNKRKYAICVKRADMWMAPNSDLVGWSATDADDEFLNASMNVNEPFIVEAVTADGKFYYGKSTNCEGWVLAENVAICENKDEWLKQWDLTNDQVLVVTTGHLALEKSNNEPDTSDVDLMLGTQLPLVPKDQLPKNISERGTWYNYVIWLPTRNADGKFVRKTALISYHHSESKNINIGYLPMTKRNILTVAFSCLGDRYGWGGMLGAMDCSMYTRSIYRCFGLEIPRNTTWQNDMPTYKVDLSKMNDEERKNAVSKLAPGTLLMFPGHITMYVGEVDGKQYVISDLGSLSETKESIGDDVDVQKMYCVSLNSLNVRRNNGLTWLQAMSTAIVPWMDAK